MGECKKDVTPYILELHLCCTNPSIYNSRIAKHILHEWIKTGRALTCEHERARPGLHRWDPSWWPPAIWQCVAPTYVWATSSAAGRGSRNTPVGSARTWMRGCWWWWGWGEGRGYAVMQRDVNIISKLKENKKIFWSWFMATLSYDNWGNMVDNGTHQLGHHDAKACHQGEAPLFGDVYIEYADVNLQILYCICLCKQCKFDKKNASLSTFHSRK